MIHRWTLRQMQAELAAGRVSAEELWAAHQAQIGRVNGSINAFAKTYSNPVCLNPEGPLAGIPVTVKDSLDMVGEATTCGSRLRLEHRAERDATTVARLKAAGAVIIGRTNTPEFLAHYETDNALTGRSRNPWNLERTPGGSSGGEAAAIAACCSAGGLGSDGGGSVRWPAHCCGLAGLKPTPGRLSGSGHWPPILHPGGLLGVVGPLARTVEDVKILFDVMAGYDPRDPFSAPVAPVAVTPAKVGWMEAYPGVPVQPAIRAAVQKAVKALGEMRVEHEPFTPEGLEKMPNVWSFFFSELPARSTKAMIAGRENECHPLGLEFLEKALQAPEPTGTQTMEMLMTRDAMRGRLLAQMAKYPILLWPAAGIEAFEHGQRRFATEGKDIGIFQMTMPLTAINLAGFPALTVPVMLSASGMPVGVQLVGRPWEEERLLDLGMRLQEAVGSIGLAPLA